MSALNAFGRAGALVYSIYALLYYLQTGSLPSISAISVGPLTLFGHQSIPVTNDNPPAPPCPAPPAPSCSTMKSPQQFYQQR